MNPHTPSKTGTLGPLLEYVLENAVRNNTRSVIEAIDNYGHETGGMIHLGGEKGEILDRVARDSGARRILELGTNYGYSALRLADSLDRSAMIVTLEIDAKLAGTARAIIAFAGMDTKIQVIRGRADRTIRSFSEPFDFLFIDHLPQNYLADLLLIERLDLLQEGATVVSDNVVVFEQQLGPYVEHLRKGGGYKSELHRAPSGFDGIEVSRRLTQAC